MVKLIALPDIHGKSEAIPWAKVAINEANMVLLAGDITNGRIEEYIRVMNTLEKYNEHVWSVGGNMESEQILQRMSFDGHNLHRRHVVMEDMVLAGVGGALPFAGTHVFSETQFTEMLDQSVDNIPTDKPLIILAHQPPQNTQCDEVRGIGHVGSQAVRDFIEDRQPDVYICGHIHEAVAIDQIGKTTIINPGPLWQSKQFAWIVIENGQVTVSLKHIDEQTENTVI